MQLALQVLCAAARRLLMFAPHCRNTSGRERVTSNACNKARNILRYQREAR